MRPQILLFLLALIFSGTVSAQSYHFQYYHDTLGNRVSRVYQTRAGAGDVSTLLDMTTEGQSPVISTEQGEWRNLDESNESRTPYHHTEKDTVKTSPLIKTQAEKDAYQDSLMDAVMKLEPLPVGGGGRSLSGYSVGAIPLEHGVSGSGARTYSVPIFTAPDIKYAPSLSLVYNSHGDFGYGGYGWDLAGLSSITLVNKCNYWDGEIKAASALNQDGAFCLDGVRLVHNTDETTNYDYPLVTASGHILAAPHRGASGHITHFTVLYPNGTRATFGTSDDRGFTMPVFPLVCTTNIEGEKIEYSYTYDSLDPTLVSPAIDCIKYGFSSNGQATGVIRFGMAYNSSICSYYAGKKVCRKPRLTSISSFSSDLAIYTYSLSYQTYGDTPLLQSIALTNQSGDQLLPLTFSYNADSPPHTGPDSLKVLRTLSLPDYFPHDDIIIYRRGKFARSSHNDGLIAYLNYLPYQRSQADTSMFVCNYPPDTPISFLASISDGCRATTMLSDYGFLTAEAVDVDGDGVDEVVRVCDGGVLPMIGRSVLRVSVFRRNSQDSLVYNYGGNILLKGYLTRTNSDNETTYSPYRRTFRWGDFLGNGKVQLLVMSYSDNGFEVPQTTYDALIDLDSCALLYDEQSPVSISSYEDLRIVCVDIDGDGQTEKCFATPSGLKVYRYKSTGFVWEKTHTNIPQNVIYSRQTYYADINADGYIDIISSPSSGSDWSFRLNTGLGFELKSISVCEAPSSDKFLFMDIDHDGYPDLLTIHNNVLKTYRNRRGIGFDSYISARVGVPSGSQILPPNTLDYSAMSCFVTLDGLSVIEYGYTSIVRQLCLLSQSRDSYGKIVRNTYGYLPQSSLYWTDNPSDINSDNGYQLRVLPVYVLTGAKGFMSEASNAQVFLNETYSWFDGVVHTQGLGFCGFSKTRVHSYLDDVHILSDCHFDPQRRGILTLSKQYFLGELSNPFSQTTFTYDSHLEHGFLSPRLMQSAVNKSIDGVLTTTTYVYDDFGFPTRVVIQKSSASIPPSPSSVVTLYAHNNSPSRYLLGVVASQASLSSKDLSTPSAMGSKKVFTYDTLFRPLKCETYRVTSTVPAQVADSVYCTLYHSSTDRWQYDSHGNVTRKESAPSGADVFIGTSYSYDTSGRHLVSSTDAMGHTTTYSGFDIYGNPAIVTNHKGQQTHSFRDGWGRVTRTVHPDGTVDSLARAWGGTALYRETTKSSGVPDVMVDFDAAGREVLRMQRRLGTYLKKVKTQYGQRGLVERVSVPYRSTSPTYWNTYRYDDYGRPVEYKEASGRKTAWSYSGTSNTERKDGIRTTRRLNPNGTLRSVADSLVTITYNYRDDGQPFSVNTSTGATTFFNYDTLGRKVSINDPSAGMRHTSYTTNADGSSSIMETNATGSITTHYDSLGRVTSIIRPDFNTTYTYDSSGRLVSKVSTNGTSSRYTYDDYDRVLTAKDSVPDGKWLQKAYTYNADGNVATIAYTSQGGYITTETYSYDKGINTSIRLPDNTTVYQLTAENALGLPTTASSGSVSRSYGYTAFGMPAFRKLGDGSLQDFSYSFDAKTGNLISRTRTQGGTSTTETFSYDNLGRLTSNNGTAIIYDINNNILYNGGNAAMTYTNASHPYEITERVMPSPPVSGTEAQTLTYKAYDRPATITQGGKTATFTYDTDYNRVKMLISRPGGNLTRYYIGGIYEIECDDDEGMTTENLYLGGDAYSAPMVMQKKGSGWTKYVIGRDYLGSITNVVSAGGTSLERRNYGAWGGGTASSYLWRGWCGHEYLEDFGLINMNARLYDPDLGRFLSPDPYIQAPDFPGNFNRYAYCLNNPLKYVDPNGEVLTTAMIVGICLGATMGGISGAIIGSNNGAKGWEMFGYILGGAAIGSVAAASAGALSGWGVGAGMTGATAGAISGSGFSYLSGNSGHDIFLSGIKGFSSGALGGWTGAAIGGGLGAFFGGAVASGSNTLLNGGSAGQIGLSMLAGGVLSYGSYELLSWINYSEANLEINGGRVSYGQYKTMQADYQRSRFWRKEYGGFLTRDGHTIRAPLEHRHRYYVEFEPEWFSTLTEEEVLTNYHTHWDAYERQLPTGERTAIGPSDVDLDYAKRVKTFIPELILIDRFSLFYYNDSGTTQAWQSYILRFFPCYIFPRK